MCFVLNIGVFHPRLNRCGGGEWVALNIINSLRQNGHKVIVLTDETIDQKKFVRAFGQRLQTDGEIVYPFRLFSKGDPHNIYTDIIGCLILKSKCNLVIDTFTCTVLPGVDAVYMHYPRFMQSTPPTNKLGKLKETLFFFPYHAYEKKLRKKMKHIIFANSKFTSEAIITSLGLRSHLLCPPLSPFFLQNEEAISGHQRLDQVVTVSRFAPEKNLEMIPYLAKRLDNVRFIVIGNLHYKELHSRLLKQIRDFGVEERVVLMTDVPKTQLRQILLDSKVYLHSAMNEHFGVSIIDAMASGCVPITHDSGGPKMFVPEKFRYTNSDEAAEKIEKAILEWSPKQALEMRNITLKFRQEVFSKNLFSILSFYGMLGNTEDSKQQVAV